MVTKASISKRNYCRENQCNCLTFNCNRLLYASLCHAMVIVIRIGAHWFCCLYSEHIISISLNPLVRCGNAEYARNGQTLQIPIGNRTVHFMCEFYESDVYLPWSAEVRIPIKIHREWLCANVCLRNMHHTIDWQSMCVLIFQHNR